MAESVDAAVALPLANRAEAGERLADRLARLRLPDPAVLGIPRGGVPVAAAIARRLGARLDLLVCRKVASPDDREYGLGGVVEDGTIWLDEERARSAGFTSADLAGFAREEVAEADRAARRYRRSRPPPNLEGREVVVVDDGIATGGTVRAAIRSVRNRGARSVLIAAGVVPFETAEQLRHESDGVVALALPHRFFAVGEFYREFGSVADEEIERFLR